MTAYKSLELKAELLVEGIRANPDALREVGVKYKEQNHGLFGWDFEDHVGKMLPDDFLLPNGTVVQFRQNSRSPYLVAMKEKDLVLSRGEDELCRVEWLPKPAYYARNVPYPVPIAVLERPDVNLVNDSFLPPQMAFFQTRLLCPVGYGGNGRHRS